MIFVRVFSGIVKKYFLPHYNPMFMIYLSVSSVHVENLVLIQLREEISNLASDQMCTRRKQDGRKKLSLGLKLAVHWNLFSFKQISWILVIFNTSPTSENN